MKANRSSLFWGILLIGLGGYALAQSMGYKVSQEPATWAFIFGGISLLSLVFYFVDGFKAWGWLFPAGIFAALAFLLAMVANDVDNPAMVAPLFFGIGLPFVVAYFIERTRNWWALIPAGAMLFLGLTMLMVDTAKGEWIGSLFLFMIALSFFAVYLNNRTRNWALLVAYILFVLSIAPAMASFSGDAAAYFGSVFLFAVALPFFIVYFRSDRNWWAIIPAGVMTTLSVIATLGIAGWIRDTQTGGISNAILMGGLAATFAVVWLRHAKPWAKIAAIVLAALAIASVFLASYTEIFWPVAIILAGAYLLFTALRPGSA
ncbi:MAG TPA: hypothetical protein VLT51_09720 [Anaerolineales bacterium]|nr:hypothetical protein [Anaerolineales bacterium]